MRKQIRFFAYQTSEGLWVAHCIDLSLAAQADTFEEVKEKLDEQVRDFVEYVNAQEDEAFREQLICRKAPFATRAHYWFAVVANKLNLAMSSRSSGVPKPWTERHQAIPC